MSAEHTIIHHVPYSLFLQCPRLLAPCTSPLINQTIDHQVQTFWNSLPLLSWLLHMQVLGLVSHQVQASSKDKLHLAGELVEVEQGTLLFVCGLQLLGRHNDDERNGDVPNC